MKAGNIRVSPVLAVAIAVSILAFSCGRGSEDTSGPDPSQATTGEIRSDPDLSPATRIEIQARALSAACLSVSCDTKPVYAYLDAGPDLRAALEDAFGTDVEFLSYQELQDATGPDGTYAHGATLFDVIRTHFPADDVAAVDIWVGVRRRSACSDHPSSSFVSDVLMIVLFPSDIFDVLLVQHFGTKSSAAATRARILPLACGLAFVVVDDPCLGANLASRLVAVYPEILRSIGHVISSVGVGVRQESDGLCQDLTDSRPRVRWAICPAVVSDLLPDCEQRVRQRRRPGGLR